MQGGKRGDCTVDRSPMHVPDVGHKGNGFIAEIGTAGPDHFEDRSELFFVFAEQDDIRYPPEYRKLCLIAYLLAEIAQSIAD